MLFLKICRKINFLISYVAWSNTSSRESYLHLHNDFKQSTRNCSLSINPHGQFTTKVYLLNTSQTSSSSSPWSLPPALWSKQPWSPLSCCISLVGGLHTTLTALLQAFLHKAVLVGFSTSTYDHVIPLLEGLQKLPIDFRIKIKMWTWPTSLKWPDSHPFLQLRLVHVPQAFCILSILGFSQFLIHTLLPLSSESSGMPFPSSRTLFLSLCLLCWLTHTYSDPSSNVPPSAPPNQGSMWGYLSYISSCDYFLSVWLPL